MSLTFKDHDLKIKKLQTYYYNHHRVRLLLVQGLLAEQLAQATLAQART